MLKEAAREFCANTSLHGYGFVVTVKHCLRERLMWATIVTLAVTFAITTSWLALEKTQRHLVQTVTDSTHHPIWNYPFPTVTICNFNQISRWKTFAALRDLRRPAEMSLDDLVRDVRLLSQLTTISNRNIPQWNLTRLQDILDLNNVPAERLLQTITPSCTDMLKRCKWRGEEKRCDLLFEQVKTVMGFCCSFNYYAIKNHSFSGILPNKTPKKPRRLTGCGYRTGLEVVIDNVPNDYYATTVASYGHNILVHNPYNYPDWNIHNLLLGIKTIMFTGVTPILTKCNSKVKNLSVKERNCLFRNEMQLHNFRYYTHHNCLVECRLKIILSHCNCIPFYYYNENGSLSDNRICNLRDKKCLMKYKRIFMSSIPGEDSLNSKQSSFPDRLDKCTCLPDCEYVDYPIECSVSEYSPQFTKGNSVYGHIKPGNQSVIKVFFADLVGTKNTKILCYYWHTLFALFGGLLSLFTGFSFGSAFEIVYFFIIRPSLKIVRRQYFKVKKAWKNQFMESV